jgi:methylenetetrahydrofolate dehydrogenase (NADP+)/methenyltetrahydrofolate cyclohydrolase
MAIIDGKKIAQDIKDELKTEIAGILTHKKYHRAPGLAVILVGEDPASQFYVARKQEACKEVGITSFKTILPTNTTKEELLAVIDQYNRDETVDGILLQLPLPTKLKKYTQTIIDQININKDVDGLTSQNLGNLVVKAPETILPCTPKGCMELLKRYQVNIEGKKTLVIGRSLLVGKPLALMLNQANATVTMAHSYSQNLEAEVKQAEILIVAIGKPEFIPGAWIKTQTVVIDVGINSVPDAQGNKKIVGDLDYNSAKKHTSLITPVPGGVGPMTVAMLLSNTVELWKRKSMS